MLIVTFLLRKKGPHPDLWSQGARVICTERSMLFSAKDLVTHWFGSGAFRTIEVAATRSSSRKCCHSWGFRECKRRDKQHVRLEMGWFWTVVKFDNHEFQWVFHRFLYLFESVWGLSQASNLRMLNISGNLPVCVVELHGCLWLSFRLCSVVARGKKTRSGRSMCQAVPQPPRPFVNVSTRSRSFSEVSICLLCLAWLSPQLCN